MFQKNSGDNTFFYKVPRVMSLDEWDNWHKQIKKDRPVQYFIRERYSDCVYAVERMRRKIRMGIKYLFKPYHSDIRKAVPRHWADVSSLIVDVNFAMILSFKKEADKSYVDWNGTEGHYKFKNWLDSAANWIQEGYPNLKKQLDNSYPPHPLPEYLKNKSYEELYSEVNRIEKLINDTNTNILKQMIEYREYMWT